MSSDVSAQRRDIEKIIADAKVRAEKRVQAAIAGVSDAVSAAVAEAVAERDETHKTEIAELRKELEAIRSGWSS